MRRLEGRGAPHTVIDALPQQIAEPRAAGVNPPGPANMAERVAALRPFVFESRFGPAIAVLLLPISADRVAAVVPHHRCRAEADRPALVLQAPADVDIVAGRAKARVEAADRDQRLLAIRHIAAGNVL